MEGKRDGFGGEVTTTTGGSPLSRFLLAIPPELEFGPCSGSWKDGDGDVRRSSLNTTRYSPSCVFRSCTCVPRCGVGW